MTFSDGSHYQGTFHRGERHGHGVIVWRDGERYEGEWQLGRRWGYGAQISATGQRLEGLWSDDRFQRAASPTDRLTPTRIGDLEPSTPVAPPASPAESF